MPQQTVRQYFKALTALHFALIMGLVFFILIVYVMHSAGVLHDYVTMAGIFQYMVPAFALIGIAAGRVMFKKQLNEIKNKDSIAEKLNAYRAVFIMRDALLEAPALFAVITYLLCGKIILLGVAVVLIVVFILIRPSKDTFIKDLELSTDETMIIEDEGAVIDG